MGRELLSEAYPTEPAQGQPPKTGAEIFDEMFPFYLSIGMSPAEYWDGDNSLPRYYREADRLKQERKNQFAWLQGLYVYNAFGAVVSQMFPEKGSSGRTYIDKPIDFSKKDVEPADQNEDKEAELAEVWMNRMCRLYKNIGAKPNK